MNIAGSAPGSGPRRLPQRSAGVEGEQLYAGVNSGRQVKAGEVLALSSGCAVITTVLHNRQWHRLKRRLDPADSPFHIRHLIHLIHLIHSTCR